MAITPEKRAALYEMEDEFWALVKRRIVVTSFVALVIGAGGMWVAVELAVQRVADTPLRDLQKEFVRAEIQAEAARRASDKARASAEEVTNAATALNTTLQGLGAQARAVEDRFKLMDAQINAASDNARRRSQQDFNAVQQRITALEALVRQVGDDNAASRKATADYANQIAALESKVEREQKRFAENSAYTVSIFFDPSKRTLATEVQARLASLGFRAPLQELTANAAKGNLLAYPGISDAKAQEVVAVLKPLVKDLEAKKLAEKGYESSISKKAFDALKMEIKPNTGIVFPLMFWSADPRGLHLQLGSS